MMLNNQGNNLNYLNYIVFPLIGLDSLDFSSEASRMLYLPCFRVHPCYPWAVIYPCRRSLLANRNVVCVVFLTTRTPCFWLG